MEKHAKHGLLQFDAEHRCINTAFYMFSSPPRTHATLSALTDEIHLMNIMSCNFLARLLAPLQVKLSSPPQPPSLK